MAYAATVLPVMIASPGDVHEERQAARDIIHDWNYIHSLSTNSVLMPVGWETHSSPDLSGRAQELINERVLADCDLLVGIFWTRLGTPTGKSASGSVEEIERHLDAGKPAMVYFSTKPIVPDQFESTQYHAVKEFKKWCQDKGLTQTYDGLDDFKSKFRRELQITILKHPYLQSLLLRAIETASESPTGPLAGGLTGSIPPMPSAGLGLTDEAKELLREAAQDRSGHILTISVMGGRWIQTNGKKLGLSDDPRTQAKWKHGLDQLIDAGFVESRGHKGEVFAVTARGYELAEQLSAPEGPGKTDDQLS